MIQKKAKHAKLALALSSLLETQGIKRLRQGQWLSRTLAVGRPTAQRIRDGLGSLNDYELLKITSEFDAGLRVIVEQKNTMRVIDVDLDMSVNSTKFQHQTFSKVVELLLIDSGIKSRKFSSKVAQELNCSLPAAHRKITGESAFSDHDLDAIFQALGITNWHFEFSLTSEKADSKLSYEDALTEPENSVCLSSDCGLESKFPAEDFSFFVREIDIALMEHKFSRGRVSLYRLEQMRSRAQTLCDQNGVKQQKISLLGSAIARMINLPDLQPEI